ncbi:hypothetical protein [Acanthopleuribacter pedis]|uniref:Uncharacterized protein n=1 Tax=Acanthopleuribacter pedis TaxID=442870 RepID=A0A8J7QQR1_9BACT|nr:hypothetical protein [Acanthopleuribacter pedis]MBO1323120.1 hypothetical protein [Acanthopleuribacter pedis]
MIHFQKNPVLFIAFVLVGVGFVASALFWNLAGFWARGVQPPTLGYGDNRIYLASDRAITVLDATGKHQFSVPVAELGLGRARAVHGLADDKVLLSYAGDVLACDLPNRTCRTLIQNATQASMRGAGKVTLRQKGDLIFVAESRKPKIAVYQNGRLTGSIDGGSQKLRQPAHMLWDPAGNLVVADARTRVIRAFRADSESPGEPVWSLTISTDLLDGEHLYPIEIAAGGEASWWVVLRHFGDRDSAFSKRLLQTLWQNHQPADALLILDDQGRAVKRVSIPEGTRPSRLIPMARGILVVDFAGRQFVPVGYDGALLEDVHAPDLFAHLNAYQQVVARYQRLQRFSFAGVILSLFLFSVVMILAGPRERQAAGSATGKAAQASGAKVYRYPEIDQRLGSLLWVAAPLLVFWVITLAWTREDGGAFGFVVMLNLAIDVAVLLPVAAVRLYARRRNAIRVALTETGISYQNHKERGEIGFASIETITFDRFFLPGLLSITSASRTISFGMGLEQGADFFNELKAALKHHGPAGGYDQTKLERLTKRMILGGIRKKRLNPANFWALAINSLFALSGFAFISDYGRLLFWCLGALMTALLVCAAIEIRKERDLSKQMQDDPPSPEDVATVKKDIKQVVIVSTLVYLVAVAAVVFS